MLRCPTLSELEQVKQPWTDQELEIFLTAYFERCRGQNLHENQDVVLGSRVKRCVWVA